MTVPRPDSLAELLLVAAHSLRDVWTLEDLTVQAHCSFRDRFAMYGHDLPCTHRVHSVVYGARGLVARGFVEEANGVKGHPFFRLTEAGRQVAAQRRQKQAVESNPVPTRPIGVLEAPAPEPLASRSIQPTAMELNLWRMGKQGEACFLMMDRYRNLQQPVSGRQAKDALEGADSIS